MMTYCDELSSLANCVMAGVHDPTCPRLSTAWISCSLRNWALHWNASHLGVRSHGRPAFCLIERALILFAILTWLKLILLRLGTTGGTGRFPLVSSCFANPLPLLQLSIRVDFTKGRSIEQSQALDYRIRIRLK